MNGLMGWMGSSPSLLPSPIRIALPFHRSSSAACFAAPGGSCSSCPLCVVGGWVSGNCANKKGAWPTPLSIDLLGVFWVCRSGRPRVPSVRRWGLSFPSQLVRAAAAFAPCSSGRHSWPLPLWEGEGDAEEDVEGLGRAACPPAAFCEAPPGGGGGRMTSAPTRTLL